jgi:hypothetical protein
MLERREVPEQGVDGQQQGAQGEQMIEEQGHGETPFKGVRGYFRGKAVSAP